MARILTALVGVPILLAVVLLGPAWLFLLLVLAAALEGYRELGTMTAREGVRLLPIGYVSTLLLDRVALSECNRLRDRGTGERFRRRRGRRLHPSAQPRDLVRGRDDAPHRALRRRAPLERRRPPCRPARPRRTPLDPVSVRRGHGGRRRRLLRGESLWETSPRPGAEPEEDSRRIRGGARCFGRDRHRARVPGPTRAFSRGRLRARPPPRAPGRARRPLRVVRSNAPWARRTLRPFSRVTAAFSIVSTASSSPRQPCSLTCALRSDAPSRLGSRKRIR